MSNPSEARCPRCAAPLPPNAPEGLCPRCLGALNLATETVPTGADAPGASPQPPLTPAELAPHFPQLEILECLGRGGMGVVYKARQRTLNRVVALKLLAPERVTDAGFAERFTREAQALARLNHPNIVTIHDFGCTRAGDLQSPSLSTLNPQLSTSSSGFYFLLMEFVDGVNLRQAMRAGRFTPEQALAIVPPVCEALQYAHEQGIVHRDIKPENLLLDKAGRIKIADFGIAKMLETGGAELPLGHSTEAAQQRGPTSQESLAAGTPQYMAPEQRTAPQRTDHRADIYSLGVVLYELLTGELPGAKLQPPSRKVQIDVRLDEIVLRALEQRPELRFQTAAELRTQVETFEREEKEERIERGERPPSLSSTLSPLSSPPRPFLKIGTSTLTTPEQLSAASGQFFCYRTRGQLILDDRQLTHSCAGMNTVIPLAAIRDLSIGRYPRTMNPAGIDLLSVAYEEGGQRKQVLLSPMEGFFGLPATWNARVAEWFLAIREATTTATGRAPGNTPAERLGVPGSSPLLLAIACVPLLVGAGLLWMLTRRTDSASSFAGGASLLIFAALVFGFLAPALFGWLSGSRRASSPGGSTFGKFSVLLLVLVPLLLFGFVRLRFAPLQATDHADVTRFEAAPVGVSNNVVIVDVTTEVGPGKAELRAMLAGPRLSASTEAALADEFLPPFAGTLVTPTLHAGNHPWRSLAAGQQTWRLGFVLPDAALAQTAAANLSSIGPLPIEPGRRFAGTLFEVRQTNGQSFRATLEVTPPLSPANPEWVYATAMTAYNESGVTMDWEVLASQPGTVRCQREGSRSTARLQLDPKSKLYRVPVRLELTKVSTNRVLLVTEAGGVKVREEFTGSFRELSAELLRFKNMSAKTVRGAEIELCQFQGKSFTVQVDAVPPPVTTAVPVKLVNWSFSSVPLWFVLAAVLALALTIGGIVLLVMLVRKGGAAIKVVLLLCGLPLLFLAVGIAALIGYRAMLVAKAPTMRSRMELFANYSAPTQPHPPGQVQQTQNGFRMLLQPESLASFEFFIQQADDSWQPVPSLTALVATGKDGGYHDSLYWTLRRGNGADGTNQLWFWSVSANDGRGRALPNLADHGTNFTHAVASGESLDWWQLATPASVALNPGEQKTIPLFRTHGTATVRGEHPKEAFLRVRCERLPASLSVARSQQLVEAGLAAHALLAEALPAKPQPAASLEPQGPYRVAASATKATAMDFRVVKVEAPPGLRDIRVHFQCAAPAGFGFEVCQDVTRGPYGEAPKSKDAFWLRTKWVGLNDPPVLVWTLPEDFTPEEVQAGAKQIEAHLRTMRDALRMLPTEAVSSFGKVRHREGWLYELVLRVKLARDHSPVQAADAWVVEGTVRDGEGKPVPEADIHVSSGAGTLFVTGRGKTGADGTYRVGFGPGISMSAGDRRGAMQAAIVHVGKPGFAEKELGTGGNLQMAWELTPQQLAGGWQAGPQRTFLPGQPLRVDFVLLPAATVRGTLLTPEGKPVARRGIVLVGDRLRPASSVYAATKTDADGRFTFKDVSTQHAWSFSIENTPHHRKRTAPDRFAEPRVHEVTLIADGDDLRRGDAQVKPKDGKF